MVNGQCAPSHPLPTLKPFTGNVVCSVPSLINLRGPCIPLYSPLYAHSVLPSLDAVFVERIVEASALAAMSKVGRREEKREERRREKREREREREMLRCTVSVRTTWTGVFTSMHSLVRVCQY